MTERLRFALAFLLIAAPAAAQPYVYTGGGVAVFDTRTEQALARRTIPGCLVSSVAFRPGSTELFALCAGTGFSPASKIIVIDPSTFQVTASIGLPAEAQDLAFTPDGSRLALALANGYVAFVDAATKQVLATTFSGTALQFDGQLRNIAMSPDGRYAFCTNPQRNTISAIDTVTFVRMFTVQASFQPGAIAVTPDSSRLLVTKQVVPSRVDVFDLAGLGVVASVPLGGGLPTIAIDASRNRAYVTQNPPPTGGADVVIIDLNTNAAIGGLSAPGAVSAVVDLSRDLLYVNAAYALLTYRLTDGALIGSGSFLASLLSRLAIAPDGVNPPTDACSYAVGYDLGMLSLPIVSPFGSNGFLNVNANPDRCSYTPSTDVPWIGLEDNGQTFAGTRTFDFFLQANHSGIPRTGHISAAGTTLTFTQAGCTDHRAVIDSPRPGALVRVPFTVTGWSINTCAPSGTGVSAAASLTTYGSPRPDVAQAFGEQFRFSGFSYTVTSLPLGTQTAKVDLYDALADSVIPATVPVFVIAQNSPPFGTIDTPATGVIVSGVMAMTGWALDDTADVQSVQIYRTGRIGEAVDPATGLVFVGSAPLIAGIRPDVQAAYPTLPHSGKAGWGTLILTNAIADGTYTFTVFASDGVSTGVIGQRTVTIQNAFVQTPFGTIDTPGEFGAVSGTFIVFGWALASPGNVIASDGSAIDVYIDDGFVGHAVYGDARTDIAQAFSGHANSSAAGAHFVLDSAALANGRHTLAWVVRDTSGHTAGIGSRFFSVTN